MIASYRAEVLSQIELARRFGISTSSVKRYLRLAQTGDLSAKKGKKGRPGKLNESGYAAICKIIQENPMITLEGLSKRFYKEKKIKVGLSILCRACQKLGLNRKKVSRYAAERDREEVKKNVKPIRKR